jgi:LacI family transcriptional regulator
MILNKKRTSIKDVAERAGVSVATVSHVINKTRYVSEEVTDRVNQAIKELKYYPNLLLRSLKGHRTYSIGLVIPSISNETFGKLTENIQRILFLKKYNLIIVNTSNILQVELDAIKTLLTKKVDGIIIIPIEREPEPFSEIKSLNVPLLFLDREIAGFEVDSVLFDYYSGSNEITNYLINRGHKNIGYIDRPLDHSHSVDQRNGYIDALKKYKIYNEELIIRAGNFDYRAGAYAAKELIKRKRDLTAIVALNDIIAIGAIRGALDEGLKIPGDISIIGFDGMPITNVCVPRLTTAKLPLYKAAKNACDLILKRIDNPSERNYKKIRLKSRMIIRESVADIRG